MEVKANCLTLEQRCAKNLMRVQERHYLYIWDGGGSGRYGGGKGPPVRAAPLSREKPISDQGVIPQLELIFVGVPPEGPLSDTESDEE